MGYLLFFGELLALFLLSRFISHALFQLFIHTTKSVRLSSYALSLIYFPGVVVHELAHAFAAIATNVRVFRMEFMPVFSQGQLKLGSVQIEKTDPLRKTIIGVAPVIGGVCAILAVLWGVEIFAPGSFFWMFVSGVFVYQVGSTMFSSKKDLEGTGVIFVIILIILIVLWFLDYPVIAFFTDSESGRFLSGLFNEAAYFLAIAVGINTFIAGVLALIVHLKRR